VNELARCHCLRRLTRVASLPTRRQASRGIYRCGFVRAHVNCPQTNAARESHASHLCRNDPPPRIRSGAGRARGRGRGTAGARGDARRRRRRTRRDPPQGAPGPTRPAPAVHPGHPTAEEGDRWSPRSPQGKDLDPVAPSSAGPWPACASAMTLGLCAGMWKASA
jgi:hypothetical protein